MIAPVRMEVTPLRIHGERAGGVGTHEARWSWFRDLGGLAEPQSDDHPAVRREDPDWPPHPLLRRYPRFLDDGHPFVDLGTHEAPQGLGRLPCLVGQFGAEIEQTLSGRLIRKGRLCG